MLKNRILNAVIGSAIFAILSLLIASGLNIFISAPEYPVYNAGRDSCGTGDQACLERQQREYQEKLERYRSAFQVYGEKTFIAANATGFIFLIIAAIIFYYGLGVNIGWGVFLAGIFGIIFGYVNGWSVTADKIKFGVSAFIAILIICGAVYINRRYNGSNLRGPGLGGGQ